jgi:hypothetical protein
VSELGVATGASHDDRLSRQAVRRIHVVRVDRTDAQQGRGVTTTFCQPVTAPVTRAATTPEPELTSPISQLTFS